MVRTPPSAHDLLAGAYFISGMHRKELARSEPKLVQNLVQLMDSPNLKIQPQAALALRNMASDGESQPPLRMIYFSLPIIEEHQVEIVKADGLAPLFRLLQSTYLPLILSAVACIRNLSIHPMNESPIIEAGFLQPLVNLLAFKDSSEVRCHAASTLRNLAANSHENKRAIFNAGAVRSIKELVLEMPMDVQSEMTACVAVLALSGMCPPFDSCIRSDLP